MNTFRLAEGLQVFFSARVLEVRVFDREVAGEHGGCDFAAVNAVADEGVDEAVAFDWLFVGDMG